MPEKLLTYIATGALALCLSACASAPPKPSEDALDSASDPANDAPSEAYVAPPEESGELNKAQEEQMIIALRRGGEKAAQCAEVVPDAVRGKGEVEVIFDGTKGRITDANVGAPFAGTPVEACIKRSFVGEIVLPFDGEPKAVPYSVTLPEKGAAAGDKKDEKKK